MGVVLVRAAQHAGVAAAVLQDAPARGAGPTQTGDVISEYLHHHFLSVFSYLLLLESLTLPLLPPLAFLWCKIPGVVALASLEAKSVR